MDILRKNPRPLSMPLLKETAKIGGSVGTVAVTNLLVIPKIVGKYPNSVLILSGVEYLGGMLIAKKYPNAGAAISGSILGAVFTGLAAYITKDVGLIAWNPAMERRLKGVSEVSGLPENLQLALFGKISQ